MSQRELPFTAKDGTEHYERDGITWQRRIMAHQVRIEGTVEHGSARITAIWDVVPNSAEVPPGNVRLRRAGERDRARSRGVTTSVMRDAERALVGLTAAMPAQVAGLSEVDPMAQIEELARRLPPGPRGFPSYYGNLLKVFTLIEATGTRSPVKELAKVTGRPEGTVKLHLRQARNPSAASPSNPH